MSHGTYKNKLLSTALLIAATPAMANVANGGFEQWTGNTPDAWTTIDSGINVSRSTSIVNNANNAAIPTYYNKLVWRLAKHMISQWMYITLKEA